ncbi:uncharacterized protein LOC125646443 isoform X2 [Ostrea edulis]|uniref:uncharacterized protein LOC125646443 isoform X2 n=1 Tax=Ostrea edulis TaxID=37623 RepID=UPI0024AEE1B0|nr:uncharacterized protein LOC125646443 isoform X2 [Ostrea edulis]
MGDIRILRLFCTILIFYNDVYGYWSFWSDWTTCPSPCEGEIRSRRRRCTTQFCNGIYYEYESCEPKDCLEPTKSPVALKENFNPLPIQETSKSFESPSKVPRILLKPMPILITSDLKNTRQTQKNTFAVVTTSPRKSEVSDALNEMSTLQKRNLKENTKSSQTTRIFNARHDQNLHTISEGQTTSVHGSDVTVAILVAVPIITGCIVLYTMAKIYKLIKDRQQKHTNDKPDRCTSLSSSEKNDEERETQEDYNYLTYNDISKRSSCENSSPTHSYVYDVTWY